MHSELRCLCPMLPLFFHRCTTSSAHMLSILHPWVDPCSYKLTPTASVTQGSKHAVHACQLLAAAGGRVCVQVLTLSLFAADASLRSLSVAWRTPLLADSFCSASLILPSR
jgi:hypothetical protein